MKPSEEIVKQSEEFNEHLLKQTALTFSLEGMKKDIKYLIGKKVGFNRMALGHVTRMLEALSTGFDKKTQANLTSPGTPIGDLMDHVFGEIEQTNELISTQLDQVLKRHEVVSKDVNETLSRITNAIQRDGLSE